MREALAELEKQDAKSADIEEIIRFFKEGDKKRGFCPWPASSAGKSED